MQYLLLRYFFLQCGLQCRVVLFFPSRLFHRLFLFFCLVYYWFLALGIFLVGSGFRLVQIQGFFRSQVLFLYAGLVSYLLFGYSSLEIGLWILPEMRNLSACLLETVLLQSLLHGLSCGPAYYELGRRRTRS